MGLLIVGAVTTLLAGVALKVVDRVLEGRVSWARRSIAADVELFNALPDALRAGEAGQALGVRIEASLMEFARGALGPSDRRTRVADLTKDIQFKREVRNQKAQFDTWSTTAAVATVVVTLMLGTDGQDSLLDVHPGYWVAATWVLSVWALMSLYMTEEFARRRVARRWLRDGRTPQPEDA